MFCPNCGNQVEDGSRFCSFCGTRFGAQPAAPVQAAPAQAYTQAENDAFFTQMEQASAVYQAETPAAAGKLSVKFKLPNIKIPPKTLILGAGGVVVLIVLIVLIASLFSGGSKPSYAMYIKDGQVFYSDLSSKAPWQVTEDLTDGEDVENSDLRSAASDLGSAMHLTGDGETLFYMDEIGEEGTLYYRSLTNFKKEPEEIASGVEQYVVCKDGKLVFFLKNGTLYSYDLKDDEKIAKDVEDFSVYEDGDYVLYKDEDADWYLIHKGGKEKIGSEIDIRCVSDKGTVYYLDEDKLYAKAVGKDKEKLLSDVSSTFGFTMDGTFYFTRSEEMMLADFFEADAEYEYWAESMKEETVSPYYSLYYYNGEEETLLAEACYNRRVDYCGESMAVYYTMYDAANLEKLSYKDLDELSGTDEYYYTSIYEVAGIMLQEALDDAAVSCIAIEGTVSQVDVENVSDFVCSPDGKAVYMLCDVDEEKSEGTAYRASVSGKKVGAAERYDEDIYSEAGFYFVGSSNYLVYYKDVEDYEGELFVNGESVDDDVYLRSYLIRYNAEENDLLYMTDYDNDKYEGTLRVYNGKEAEDVSDDVYGYTIGSNGKVLFMYDYNSSKWEGSLAIYDGKVTEIADDVHSYTFTPAGDVLFLYDYSLSKYRGNLATFTGKEVKDLDEDVVALIPVSSGNYHYFG